MERLRRLLRNATLRGDRVAILNIQGRIAAEWRKAGWTETELRAAWGDQ